MTSVVVLDYLRPLRFKFDRTLAFSVALALIAFVTYEYFPSEAVRSGRSEGLMIEHASVVHSHRVEDVTLRVARSKGQEVQIAIPDQFGREYELDGMSPLPVTVAPTKTGQVLTFVAPVDSDLNLTLHLRSRSFGRRNVGNQCPRW